SHQSEADAPLAHGRAGDRPHRARAPGPPITPDPRADREAQAPGPQPRPPHNAPRRRSAARMSAVPTIQLNDGHPIPQLGFGVFQIHPDETAAAVTVALETGYRHIDTAEMYGNEKGVGHAVLTSGLDRSDLFITTELHPYFLSDEVRAYGEAHGIATQAWSPIAQGNVLGDPVITAIADRVGRTPAQVVLRWHIQRDSIVFPKSTTPTRIEENFKLFDFQLQPDDIKRIDELDRGETGRIGPHPDTFDRIPMHTPAHR